MNTSNSSQQVSPEEFAKQLQNMDWEKLTIAGLQQPIDSPPPISDIAGRAINVGRDRVSNTIEWSRSEFAKFGWLSAIVFGIAFAGAGGVGYWVGNNQAAIKWQSWHIKTSQELSDNWQKRFYELKDSCQPIPPAQPEMEVQP